MGQQLMPRGRKISEEYIPVIEWLNEKAKPGGPALIWQNFDTEEEARGAMRRLRACLSSQVKLPEGRHFSVRRSLPDNGPGVDVVVFVVDEPRGVRRLKQGQH